MYWGLPVLMYQWWRVIRFTLLQEHDELQGHSYYNWMISSIWDGPNMIGSCFDLQPKRPLSYQVRMKATLGNQMQVQHRPTVVTTYMAEKPFNISNYHFKHYWKSP